MTVLSRRSYQVISPDSLPVPLFFSLSAPALPAHRSRADFNLAHVHRRRCQVADGVRLSLDRLWRLDVHRRSQRLRPGSPLGAFCFRRASCAILELHHLVFLRSAWRGVRLGGVLGAVQQLGHGAAHRVHPHEHLVDAESHHRHGEAVSDLTLVVPLPPALGRNATRNAMQCAMHCW